MSESLSLRGRRQARRFEDSETVDVGVRPFLSRLVDRQTLRRLERSEDRQALSIILAERFENDETPGEGDDRGFFERLVDWLSDPENREKILEIVAWFISILDMFGGAIS